MGTPRIIGPEMTLAVMKKTNFHCGYCGVHASKQSSLTLDHIYPRILGGRDAESNLLPACFNCNQLKSARTLEEFRIDLVGEGGTFFCEDGVPKTFRKFVGMPLKQEKRFKTKSLGAIKRIIWGMLKEHPNPENSRRVQVITRLLEGEREIDLKEYDTKEKGRFMHFVRFINDYVVRYHADLILENNIVRYKNEPFSGKVRIR